MKNKTLKVGDWTEEKIRLKIATTHEQENDYNRKIGGLDNLSKYIKHEKAKLTKMVSKNMKYRNLLISFLPKK